jgi:hypothetical protein
MRFSAITALCAAPLALAGMLQAELVPRGSLRARDGHLSGGEGGKGGSKEVQHGQGGGHQIIVSTTVIIVWVCKGAGATTEQISPTQQAPAATHTVS